MEKRKGEASRKDERRVGKHGGRRDTMEMRDGGRKMRCRKESKERGEEMIGG